MSEQVDKIQDKMYNSSYQKNTALHQKESLLEAKKSVIEGLNSALIDEAARRVDHGTLKLNTHGSLSDQDRTEHLIQFDQSTACTAMTSVMELLRLARKRSLSPQEAVRPVKTAKLTGLEGYDD